MKRRIHKNRITTSTVLSLMAVFFGAHLSSCSNQLGSGSGEKKAVQAGPPMNETANQVKVSTSQYRVEVRSASKMLLCSGPATLEIMNDFQVRFPDFKLRCQGFDLDLASMLQAAATEGDGGQKAADLIEHDGYVLSIGKIGEATYDPPRPFVLGPVIQDPEKYRGFSRVYQTRVKGKSKLTGQTYDAPGAFKVSVVNNKTDYKWPDKNINLENVIHWKIQKAGFDGIPPTFGMLFTEMEWHFSYRPILIPVIRIKGNISDFVSKNPNGPATDDSMMQQMVGELTTTLMLEKHE